MKDCYIVEGHTQHEAETQDFSSKFHDRAQRSHVRTLSSFCLEAFKVRRVGVFRLPTVLSELLCNAG